MKGNIRPRTNKDGTVSYLCQVYAGRDPATGRRRYRTAVAKNERQAHKLVHQLIDEVESAEQAAKGGTALTLAQVIDAWLETGGPSGEATRNDYLGYVKRYISPHIGSTPVRKLGVHDLERWYATLRQSGLSPATIRRAHTVVRGALTQAVRWGWIPVNVAAQARPPRVPKPVIATPTGDGVRRMIVASQGVGEHDRPFAVFVRLAAVTGARPGELCGLRWSDIDWEAGEMHVRRRVIRATPRPKVEDLTKTGKTRTVPLDAGTLDVLREHQEAMTAGIDVLGEKLSTAAYVFANDAECLTPWRPDSTSRKFRTFLETNQLEKVPLYGLRHHAATAMIDQGYDPRTAAERLGNSPATVLSTYTRRRAEADRAAADFLGKLVDG